MGPWTERCPRENASLLYREAGARFRRVGGKDIARLVGNEELALAGPRRFNLKFDNEVGSTTKSTPAPSFGIELETLRRRL